MVEIKLSAHIVNGKIELSEEQQQKLMVINSDSPVAVIIRADQTAEQMPEKRDILKEMAELGYESIIDYLMDYPFDIPNPIRFTRDELYER